MPQNLQHSSSFSVENTRKLFQGWLESRSDDHLARILFNRKDTLYPLPPSISSLAVRLELKTSITKALRQLNAVELAIIELLNDYEHTAGIGGKIASIDCPQLIHLVETTPEAQNMHPPLEHEHMTKAIHDALDHLYDLALVFSHDEHLFLAPHVAQSLPTWAKIISDSPGLTESQAHQLLAQLTPEQKKIVETLHKSGGVGITKDARADADPSRPIPQMISAGILIAVDEATVRLPRVIRDTLRGYSSAPLPLFPPANTHIPINLEQQSHHGAGTGLEMIRLLRDLLDTLAQNPIALLKDGCIGVRHVHVLCKQLDCQPLVLARLISFGIASGLISTGVLKELPEGAPMDNYCAPTELYDEWLDLELGQQWAWIVWHWWTYATMLPWLVGETDHKDKPMRLLHPDTFHEQFPEIRTLLLKQFHALSTTDTSADTSSPQESTGSAVSITTLRAHVGFCSPIQAAQLAEHTYQQLLAEAAFLGILNPVSASVDESGAADTPLPQLYATTSMLGALTYHASQEQETQLYATAKALTPQPIDYVIFQSDLTILAPGPLTHKLYSEISLLADRESSGLASVFRISETSLSRAFSAGRNADDILHFLDNHTPMPIPDAVAYLIHDVGRKYGNIRMGTALSYIRCSDDALLAQVCNSVNGQGNTLRQLAPTVAISTQPLRLLLEQIKEMGFHPSVENEQGLTIDIRPPAARVSYQEKKKKAEPEIDELLHCALDTLRHAQKQGKDTAVGLPATDMIKAAIKQRTSVLVHFVDRTGTAQHKEITPIAITGQQVSAVDKHTGAPLNFLLPTVTEVAEIL
ncbi:hypothetical protein EML15_06465 [Corynebacterium sp. sy017]|uniref:helicase-associated domain-containing protein n=1 Tax=unclassified Corynebacterium TaxID=2624378 RepID=UPI0011866475|nr:MULTISPECIES: helicase-associated domain-containing protein [unclassified Corynebacterium]MBP3088788.1 hypothetical protein [Corynebacterium sp. sy017]TSD91131.1 hypothetical protein ELY17_06465 [Corynebacterium sp. SY003]